MSVPTCKRFIASLVGASIVRGGLLVGLVIVGAWYVATRHPGSTPTTVDVAELDAGDDGVMLYRGHAFTGTSVMLHAAQVAPDVIAETAEWVDGRRHGVRRRWHPNGQLASRTSYQRGRLHGLGESFWGNGNRRSRTTYDRGRTQGTSIQWYREGMKFKERNLVDGKEQGLQRAWRRNGAVYANYEAVAGRNYGLQQPNLCFEVTPR